MFQMQFNRRSGLSGPADWRPMPEGRGTIEATRQACMAHRRTYIKAWRNLAGEYPTIETRIASGRFTLGA